MMFMPISNPQPDPTTWSADLQQAVKEDDIGIIPYDLTLDYNYWTYRMYVGYYQLRKLSC